MLTQSFIPTPESEAPLGNQFGTIKGVFVPSILTILGVILFLRLGWVVGSIGLFGTIVIILMSSLITFITGLSISATATNAKVGPGGSYFLISRCFGVEPGAAVGIPLYLAQALGISFYSVGFAESLELFFPEVPIKTVAIVTLVILTAVTLYSSELALRTQTFILAAITLAILSFWLGTPVGRESGIESMSDGNTVGFWAVFAVFFPAVTGIEAGISMSGDLADPRKSLPRGTLAAVGVGVLVYCFSAYWLDIMAPPEVLLSNSLILTEIAWVPALVFVGLWGATLSSAMGALLGAPRTLQALAKDRILPQILARGSQGTNEPKIATVISALVALAGILLGDLNAIASVLSMFFLTSYGALNLVSGLEGLIDNPSWRPAFRVSWVVSLIGAALCFGAMFMIDSGSSFIAFGLIFVFYYLTKIRKLRSNFSDIRGGLTLYLAKRFLFKLIHLKRDVRNWRPNFLIFLGSVKTRMHLLEIAKAISHNRGFMTAATLITDESVSLDKVKGFQKATQELISKNGIQCFSKFLKTDSFRSGAINLADCYGFGSIFANTAILGDTSQTEDNDDYFDTLVELHRREINILVIRDNESTQATTEKGGSRIDVWWDVRIKDSRDLMLTLAYMLSSSRQWRSADLRVKAIAARHEDRGELQDSISHFFAESRIDADVDVYVAGAEDSDRVIVSQSKDADLVFLTLGQPTELEQFKRHYFEKMQVAEQLNTVIFVCQSERMAFQEIFN